MFLLIIAFTILAIFIFKKVIFFINENDLEVDLNLKKIDKNFILLAYFIFISMFFYKYKLSIAFVFYYITIVYLIITAYIDFKTRYIYTIINVFFGIISFLFLMYLISINIDIRDSIRGIFLTVIISVLFSKLKVWNWGDTEMFIVIAPIIATGGSIYILFNFFISMILSSISAIITFIFKGFKMQSRQAFAPYIAISSLILLFIK